MNKTTVETPKVDYLQELSNFIFTSKYARYNEKLKRRETWDEAVNRVLQMHLKKYHFLNEEDKNKVKWAFDLVRQKKVLPSMRSLQFGGKAIEVNNSRIYNCCVRHVDSIRSFSEIFFLLLSGCGVGIGLSKFFLDRLPDLVTAKNKTGIVLTYVCEDHIEGWADSLEALLSCYFQNTAFTGRKIIFDYSRIRSQGSILKTGGGKAPGHKGLKYAHQKIKELLDHIIEFKYQTRLKSIDACDILMHAADSVLSGGSRRSACATIFSKDDDDMMKAKSFFKVDKVFAFHFLENRIIDGKEKQFHEGKIKFEGKKYEVQIDSDELQQLKEKNEISWRHLFPQRGRSNNSVLLLRSETKKEDFEKIINITKQYGEPSFTFANHPHQLFNPCQPAEAFVLTPLGIRTFAEIDINSIIWSSEGWTKVISKQNAGIKPVYKYITTHGHFLGTENHQIVCDNKKIEVKDAIKIDSLVGIFDEIMSIYPQDVLDGLVLGDGGKHHNKPVLYIGKDDKDYYGSEINKFLIRDSNVKGECHTCYVDSSLNHEELPKIRFRRIPNRFLNNNVKLKGLLRGLFSANGNVCILTGIHIKSTSNQLIEDIQLALSSLGIKSCLCKGNDYICKIKGKFYNCKGVNKISITTDAIKFIKSIGFIQKYKQIKLQEYINKKNRIFNMKSSDLIKSVEFVGNKEVFDITVDNVSHTYWTGGLNVSNCFEIGFIPVSKDGQCGIQYCNLTSINGKLIKDKDDFKNAVEAETIIGTLQAGYTDFHYVNKISKDLTEEEALLGCSINGMLENCDILLNAELQKQMAEHAKNINKQWSEKININPSARTCCVKPEGTGSLVISCSSGIHAHHARKYFRRVQNTKIDNVYKFFKKNNPSACEKSVWNPSETEEIATFPIEISEKAIIKKDLSAIEHLEIIKSTQQNWVKTGTTEFNNKPLVHNVSCTIVVKENEWKDIIDYLYKNNEFFSAVSFIPDDSGEKYPQMPLEAIETVEDEERWNKLISNFKSVDYTQLKEEEDETTLLSESACAGGACEIKI